MISINIQFKLIIFSFIVGFFFSDALEKFNNKIKKFSKHIQIILSFIFIFILSFIYFIGIQIISNAILHIYSILSIIAGFITYDLIIKIIANNSKK